MCEGRYYINKIQNLWIFYIYPIKEDNFSIFNIHFMIRKINYFYVTNLIVTTYFELIQIIAFSLKINY